MPIDAPLLLLHGFTQNRRCFGDFADALAVDATVTAVDLPGHGDAGEDRATLWEGGAAIAASHEVPSVLVGYSMGGRFALHAALSAPSRIAALVLIGAQPGLRDPAERAARRDRDHALARHLETVGVEAFCDEWLAMAMFATLPPHATFRAQRLTNSAPGLASSLRLAGTGSQDDLWPRLGELAGIPMLAVAGELDEPYSEVARNIGRDVAVIDGAGHAAHLERPDETAFAVIDWLNRN